MSKTKIVVLHLKEIIYTAIFIGLGILLILLLVIMFFPKSDGSSDDDAPIYKPGVYTSQMQLDNATLNLEIVVDDNHVNSIRFVNLDEAVSAMYPLVGPALTEIADQLYDNVSLGDIEFSEENQYTSVMILDTIKATLKKASQS